MKGTVNGWTILHLTHIHHDQHVSFATQDARINDKRLALTDAVSCVFTDAKPGWLYAVRFKNSELIGAVLLQKI